MPIETDYNRARYQPGQRQGFYESFFLRANHPREPLAFWIRYTVFQPRGQPERAIGELWAIAFDGRRGQHVAVKQELPIARCSFDREAFGAKVGEATLAPGRLDGEAASGAHRIRWDLRFAGDAAPVFLLPAAKYAGGFPRAKSLVGLPMARFDGVLEVDGEKLSIEGWTGSQNHNWGTRHTDSYAWGQVCGFDDAPDSFLEVASARLRFGPVWTPLFTPVVLRHAGREHALNGLWQTVAGARGEFVPGRWTFGAENDDVRIDGDITAPKTHYVALRYYNPPGGVKYCLNSKIAACRLQFTDKDSGRIETLAAQNRAAFEVLTDELPPGIALAC